MIDRDDMRRVASMFRDEHGVDMVLNTGLRTDEERDLIYNRMSGKGGDE